MFYGRDVTCNHACIVSRMHGRDSVSTTHIVSAKHEEECLLYPLSRLVDEPALRHVGFLLCEHCISLLRVKESRAAQALFVEAGQDHSTLFGGSFRFPLVAVAIFVVHVLGY